MLKTYEINNIAQSLLKTLLEQMGTDQQSITFGDAKQIIDRMKQDLDLEINSTVVK